MRRSWLLAVVVALAALGAAWWLLRDEPTAAAPGETLERTNEERTAPMLAGRAGPAAAPEPEARLASVVGTVRRGGRPVAARVEARAVRGGGLRDRELQPFEVVGNVPRYLATGDASGPADAATTAGED